MTSRLDAIRAAIMRREWDKAHAMLQTEIVKNPSADAYYLCSLIANDDSQKLNFLYLALSLDAEHPKATEELRRMGRPLVPPEPVTAAALEARPQSPPAGNLSGHYPRNRARPDFDLDVDVEKWPSETTKTTFPELMFFGLIISFLRGGPSPASRHNFEGQLGRDRSEPNYELAGIGTRFVANILDAIIFLVLSNVIGFVFGFLVIQRILNSDLLDYFEINVQAIASILSLVLFIILCVAYYLRPILTNGQTLGKQLCGIRIVKRDHGDLTWGDVILRNVIGYFLSAVIFGIGYLIALGDENRQTLHDKLANTLVVKR